MRSCHLTLGSSVTRALAGAVLLALPWGGSAWAQLDQSIDSAIYDQAIEPLLLGPVEGLTTGWHNAPDVFAVPLGTELTFELLAPVGMTVQWVGADEVSDVEGRLLATCSIDSIGTHSVGVDVFDSYGQLWEDFECAIDGVDVALDQVRVRAFEVVPLGMEVHRDLTNEETMTLFAGPSVAALQQIGQFEYVTSIDNPLVFRTEVVPEALGALVEVRENGVPIGLGSTFVRAFEDVGARLVSAGPVGAERGVALQTYEVTIVSQDPPGPFQAGVPVRFCAETNPRGFERGITWLASSKYGEIDPVAGRGPCFETRFENINWTGVKADHAGTSADPQAETEGCKLSAFTPGGAAVCADPGDLVWCVYTVRRKPGTGPWPIGAGCGPLGGSLIGTLCVRCPGAGTCPDWAGRNWKHTNAAGAVICSGEVVGFATDDSKQACPVGSLRAEFN